MTVETLAEWLRCPVCEKNLEPAGRLTLGCSTRHRFDVNKRGYVNLVRGGSALIGDSAAMLDARADVLDSGLYSPIASAIVDALRAASARHETGGDYRVVDAGVGTGYYLKRALDGAPHARGLAMDLSPVAVARATRNVDAVDGLVADTWSALPIRDAVCNAVLNVFAPRNIPEFHRILAPGGSLIVVVPLPEHLAELRVDGRMLGIPSDKSATVIDAAAPFFTVNDIVTVRSTIDVTPAIASALIGMGPSAHHTAAEAPLGAPDDHIATRATLAVQVLHLSRLPG